MEEEQVGFPYNSITKENKCFSGKWSENKLTCYYNERNISFASCFSHLDADQIFYRAL